MLPSQFSRYGLLVLILATLLASISGCVSQQTNNETSTSANPVNVTYTYCHAYNGTSYLTGVIQNVGTQNLLNISLQAEGYANNNTTLERGYAGPLTGVDSTLLPGESTPFMIKMSSVTSGATNTALSNRTQTTSASIKPTISTKNIVSNRSIAQNEIQTVKQCDLRYKILVLEYRLSNAEPNQLTIANNKTRFSNQTVSVSGEVYNGGARTVSSSLVTVAFYRNDGHVIGVFVGSPEGELAPKTTASFQIDVPSHFFDSSISSANATRIEVYAYELYS